jgi:C-terminal processing protease CtpA/Prc
VQVAPGEWVIGSRDIEKVRVDPQRFLAEELNVRTVTMPKGERTQLEINHVEDGSLAATYGARKGDRIISVNGIPMSSIAGAINWFKQNSDLPTYVVVFERSGQEQSLTIHVK